MTRAFAILALLSLLAACAATPTRPGPDVPDTPDCAKPEEKPIDGGLGGTGRAPETAEDCAPAT